MIIVNLSLCNTDDKIITMKFVQLVNIKILLYIIADMSVFRDQLSNSSYRWQLQYTM